VNIRVAVALCCGLLLAGCAGEAAIRGRLPAGEAALAAYALHGRFAWRDGDEAINGRLVWSRQAEEERVLVQDPFGSGVGELVQSRSGAQLTLADGRQYAAADGETLLAEATGLRIPLGSLGVWLAGRGVDGYEVEAVERDAAGRVTRFRHDGWRIEYRYRESAPLPAGLRAAHDGGAEIRLAIERWELPE
jgi:outer membrane lipoprotein LolB